MHATADKIIQQKRDLKQWKEKKIDKKNSRKKKERKSKTSNDIIAEDSRWKVLLGLIYIFVLFPDITWWSFSYIVVHDLMCDKSETPCQVQRV